MGNLLITGGAGFIGSNFVAQAVARGHHVTVLDALTYAGDKANLEWIPASTKGGSYDLVVGNILDQELVSQLLRERQIESLVNFAAESHVDKSIAGPEAFVETNIKGTFTLLEAARAYYAALSKEQQSRFRFLQISTDEVYGSLGPTGAFSEISPLRPNSPYSASKAAGDHLVRAWFETYGLPTLTTHCTNNYGPRQHPEKLIPHMIFCALNGEPLPIYGDGKNIRDWIHVDDHCNGIWLTLEQGRAGDVYDFGGNAEVDNLSLVRQLCALLDSKRPKESGSYADQIAFVADRLGHDRRYAIDDSKAMRFLGFKRRYQFAQGLEATIDWYLANISWRDFIKNKPKQDKA